MTVFRRRQNRHVGILYVAVAVLFLSLSYTRHEAQAGIDLSGCPVPTRIDEKLSVVAQLQRDKGQLFIAVNPFSFFYSPETMLWLYFRQCALAELMKDDAGKRSPTPEENERIDCLAINIMQQRGLIDRFGLESIDRTIDPKLMPDFEKQLGAYRRIDVFSCARASAE